MPKVDFLIPDYYPLRPFVFLLDPSINLDLDFAGLKNVRWNLPALAVEGKLAMFHGEAARAVEFPSPRGEKRGIYQVYFSKAAPSRLLGWVCRIESGELFSELTVEKWARLAAPSVPGGVEYPSHFVTQYYDTSKSSAPSPTFRYRTSLQLEALEQRPDIASFRIDRSEASQIYDERTETLTPSASTAP